MRNNWWVNTFVKGKHLISDSSISHRNTFVLAQRNNDRLRGAHADGLAVSFILCMIWLVANKGTWGTFATAEISLISFDSLILAPGDILT